MKRSRLTVLVAIIASVTLLHGCSGEAAKDTGKVASHLSAGASFLSQRLYEKAIEEFTLAIAIDDDCAEAYCDRGVSRYMTGEPDEAMRDFETAIEKDPTLGKAHFHRALLLDEAGATREAIGAYESFIRYSQRSPAVYVERANRRLRELKGSSPPLSRGQSPGVISRGQVSKCTMAADTASLEERRADDDCARLGT